MFINYHFHDTLLCSTLHLWGGASVEVEWLLSSFSALSGNIDTGQHFLSGLWITQL